MAADAANGGAEINRKGDPLMAKNQQNSSSQNKQQNNQYQQKQNQQNQQKQNQNQQEYTNRQNCPGGKSSKNNNQEQF